MLANLPTACGRCLDAHSGPCAAIYLSTTAARALWIRSLAFASLGTTAAPYSLR
jgi:hypothetical protein